MSVERAEQQAASRTTDTYVAQMFGKQGAGAPVRGESGEVVATYHIDGDTQMGNLFRNNFGVHATVRYGEKGTVNEYKAALDQQSVERAQKVERERTEQQTSEPGFFLKPSEKQPSRVRVAKDVSPGELERRVNYAKTLEEQSKDQKTRKQQQQAAAKATGDDYKPWGKGIGTVDRDTEGKLVKKVPVPWVQAEPTIVNFLGKPGAGAPVVEGSGRLSPQKQSVSPDPFDPFGKPGAGAPGLDGARRQRGADDQGPSLSPTARQGLLREQQAMIEAHRQQERDAAVANGGGSSPDQFFKFGQGAANPKRDDNGMLQRQNRGQTDIIGMNLDTGGGLGRKQKTENSRALHDALDRQAQDKMTTESSTRQMTIAEEQKHVSAAGTWQGKPGAGAPRRNEQGEVHGRYGLDKEMHYEELVDTPKNTALPERKKYGDDLNKMINDKSTLSQQQVALGREKSNVHASSVNSKFGKQGNGAPLRDAQGKLVAQPSRLREKTDVEWKVNVKPGYTME